MGYAKPNFVATGVLWGMVLLAVLVLMSFAKLMPDFGDMGLIALGGIGGNWVGRFSSKYVPVK